MSAASKTDFAEDLEAVARIDAIPKILGTPIPPETRERLFKPYTRASDRPGQQGLGLGLYIASQIAHAHGGTLEVESSPDETRFTFRMPAPAEQTGS